MATLAQDQLHPVDPLDVSRSELYRDDTWQEPFRTLRATAPIHYTEHSDYGAYWSISTYKPIVHIESLPEIFSSAVGGIRSEEHTSELQSLMRISYAVFCLKKKINTYDEVIHIKQ